MPPIPTVLTTAQTNLDITAGPPRPCSMQATPATRVNLPIGLMDWGLRVGAQFAPEMEGLDLGELSEILRSGADGKIVEVIDEEDGERVEIYIE